MTHEPLDRILKKTLEDFKVSRNEKRVLQRILDELGANDQQRAFFRHRAFELARAEVLGPEAHGVLDWLESIVKILDADEPTDSSSHREHAEAFFSPGDDCRNAINGQLRRAKRSVDICVFTITDNRISDCIIETIDRGVSIRIISDNDKSEDRGSDIERFERAGIEVAIDKSEHHMHHKFAIFDQRITLTGSYNWTRSAAERNEENILVTHDARIVNRFLKEFNQLWSDLR
ncbi:MAG: nuclease [Planctomycetes bacterium]|nr:nuclease [Planctomycetota bacterium]